MDSSDKIIYVKLPGSFTADLGTFTLNPDIPVPFSVPEGRKSLEKSDYTVENMLSGLISVVAEDEKNSAFSYYRDLILAIDPSLCEKLAQAAAVKEKTGDYDFALLLSKAVYHIHPDPASAISLATVYSYMAVDSSRKGEDNRKYIKEARSTLLGALERNGENADLLYEIASFEAFFANLEEASEYARRFLAVSEEGERKEEIKKLLKDISFKLDNSRKIEEAYDFLSLGESDKALPVAESFIKSNPDVWNGYFLRGWALRMKKEYARAEKDFLKCIELGESNAEIYNELALCELAGGNRELAVLYLESAYDRDEENITVLSNLSLLSLEDGAWDKAREYLEKARYISKDDSLVNHLIKKYEETTGEKIQQIIHEEIVESEGGRNGEDIKDQLFRSFEKDGNEDGHVCAENGDGDEI